MEQTVTVKWIADDPKHYLHGSIEQISWRSILSVNGVDVASLAGSLNLNVGDLLKVSTWPMWSAVVMPFDAADLEPRTKRPRMMESKDTNCLNLTIYASSVILCIRVL